MKVERIALWGNSGSGKSTLAERVSHELTLPLRHIDHIAWSAGWQYREEGAFLAEQQPWIAESRWLIEGVGHRSGIAARFVRSDFIIFLDTPLEVCRQRAQQRISEECLNANRFIANGCRYADVVDRQGEVIDFFHHRLKPELEQLIATQFGTKRQLTLDGRKSTEELCSKIKNVCREVERQSVPDGSSGPPAGPSIKSSCASDFR